MFHLKWGAAQHWFVVLVFEVEVVGLVVVVVETVVVVVVVVLSSVVGIPQREKWTKTVQKSLKNFENRFSHADITLIFPRKAHS